MWKTGSKKPGAHRCGVLLVLYLIVSFVGAALVAARASPVGADAHTSRLRAGTSPAPTPPAKPFVRRKRRPTLWGPRGQKKKMPSFLVQLENRHRSS